MKETVHSANVATFIKFYKKLKSLKHYNPNSTKLKIDALEELKLELKEAVNEVKKAEKLVKSSNAKRYFLYNEILVRAYKISFYISQISKNEDHLAHIKQLLFRIIGKKTTEIEVESLTENKALNSKSKLFISKKLFDNRKRMYFKLCVQLSKSPEYEPEEESIQLQPLYNLSKLLQIHTRNLIKREELLEKSKQYRDLLLYHENIGATALARRIKQYVSEVYKPASKEFKTVNSISFLKVENANRNSL